MTTAALSSLRTGLYPHGTAAFNTAQQLAGGAVLSSAYTIGSHANDAGALNLAQSVSAAQTAFTTAAITGCLAIIGTLCVRRTTAAPPTPAFSTERRFRQRRRSHWAERPERRPPRRTHRQPLTPWYRERQGDPGRSRDPLSF
ncbi:hypothetical protein [Streptomyces sp. NBC_00102]|uniref:hypothetical protein n=1 Tax=Streptomyces sp. NBC_00102 TaxID=2975652 RepID=UPI00225A3145|nr:hypothetical protein [Streptomyces sp. NBC_00102]MCX5398669.1 hypothetical protein [Streptomyces sp. NBC_00102]